MYTQFSTRLKPVSASLSCVSGCSDISVARLPKGAKVWDVVIMHDGLGTGVTLAVGDSADADRYVTATAAANAGVISMHNDGAIDGFGFEQTAETDILITTGGGSASGTIKMKVVYAVE